jgi:hypothetical protein
MAEYKFLPLTAAGEVIEQDTLFDSPSSLVMIALPKQGKSNLLAGNKKCLIVDLEGSTNYIKGAIVSKVVIDVLEDLDKLTIEIPDKNNENPKDPAKSKFMLRPIFNVVAELIQANNMIQYRKLVKQWNLKQSPELKNQIHTLVKKMPFPVVAIDTLTSLSEAAKLLAYKYYIINNPKTTKSNIKLVDNYGGQQFVREAMFDIKNFIETFAAPFIIWTGHTKDKVIKKDATDITIADLDLDGKLPNIFTTTCDAICTVSRDDEGVYMDFSNIQGSSASRSTYIPNEKLLMSTLFKTDEKGTISTKPETYWNKIYPELFN